MGNFSQGGYSVDVGPDGKIQVKPGDSLSKYSMAMFGNFSHIKEYHRMSPARTLTPVSNVNLIRAGETLYHEPTFRLQQSPLPATPEPDLGECPTDSVYMTRSMFQFWVNKTTWGIVSALPYYTDYTNLSSLMAPMLRTYINGTNLTPSLKSEIVREVSLTNVWGRLVYKVESRIQRQRQSLGRTLTQAELDRLARDTINSNYKDAVTGQMMYFRNDDRGLQGVIGGIHELRVDSVSVSGSAYQIDAVIKDKYDFVNKQNTSRDLDLRAYVEHRTALANFLACQNYDDFVTQCTAAFAGTVPRVSRSRAVAAYFYALELNRYTPGGYIWEVTIPITGHM